MESVMRDLRYALRTLRRRPGFTVVAVLTLALGIGANTAVFSVVNALLFRPLPVERAESLVSLAVSQKGLSLGGQEVPIGVSYADYRDYRELKDIFEDAIAFSLNVAQLRAGENVPERVFLQIVSVNYFSMLGIEAPLGRVFGPEEVGRAADANLMVLSHAYWQSRFASDPAVVGKTVHLNGSSFTIVGVTPESFPGTGGPLVLDAYVPVTAWDLLYPSARGAYEERGNISYRMIARLQPGVSLNEARASVDVLATNLAQEYPDTNAGARAWVHPEPMTRLEPSASVYMPRVAAVFMSLVSLVLLIACANVANLLLARAAGRRKEIAIRAALGSGRLRVVRQLLTESLLLALAGAAGGLLLAHWATRAISSIRIATDLPIAFDVSLNFQVFFFALAVAVLTGIVSGLVPSVQSARANLYEALKLGGRTSGGGRQRLRGLLVVSQVAVSLVLLTSAGLFMRSMRNFSDMDLGFRVENHLMMTMDAGLRGLEEADGRLFFRDLLDRVRALPGVRSASLGTTVPIGMGQDGTRVFAAGRIAGREEQNLLIFCSRVASDYFKTMDIPMVAGRPFTRDDTEGSRGVVIVNEVLAEQLWPGEDPLVQRLSTEGPDGPFLDVIGVAKTSTYNLPGETPWSFLYLPFAQSYRASPTLHVHTEANPAALVATIRGEIQSLDVEMPVFDVRTMETHIREGKAALMFQLGSGLVGAFGLIGVALACIGLYGVMAYWVSQRIQEMGVRMALGANSGNILTLVLRHGLMLTLVGVALGLGGAFLLTRSFANLLVGVSATDPLTFGGVSLLLMAVAGLSAYIPARRATRVDPLVALHSE